MKLKAAAAAIIAFSMISGEAALAQGRGNSGDRDDRGDRGRGHSDRGHSDVRPFDRHDSRGRGPRKDHHGERGAGPDHSFYRGDRLPMEYRHRQYVVSDWRGHHLSAPPRGYHWVQSGGDYLLVAIATGVILQLLLNN